MQVFTVLREVKTNVEKLNVLKDKSKKEALDYLVVSCKAPKEILNEARPDTRILYNHASGHGP